MDIINAILKDAHLVSLLQGAGAALALTLIQAMAAKFDDSKEVDAVKPYLQQALVILTALVAVVKAALAGNVASAPWDFPPRSVSFLPWGSFRPWSQTWRGSCLSCDCGEIFVSFC